MTGNPKGSVPEHASFDQPFLSASWVSDTEVPEPASAFVLFAGLAGLGWGRLRRRKGG